MRLVEDFRCRCGESETEEHIIMDCPLYEDNRAALQKRKIDFHLGLDVGILPPLIENKVAYEAFSKFAAEK
ncbi:hypothetical protein O3M35_008317 [Rhynocoris fuscipes]|uniref:Reverse transcriptase n=1 Tax=Rhynocoris fuscipes TaxID=488301 RepID=A0AAW1D9D0_9HEMI